MDYYKGTIELDAENMLKEVIERRKEESGLGWEKFSMRIGIPYSVLYSIRVGRRGVSREVVKDAVKYFENDDELLRALATDYFGREVVEIKFKQ